MILSRWNTVDLEDSSFVVGYISSITSPHPGTAFRDSGTPGGVPRDVDRLFFLPYIPFNAVAITSESRHDAETIESECLSNLCISSVVLPFLADQQTTVRFVTCECFCCRPIRRSWIV